jgi:hypothetical protein
MNKDDLQSRLEDLKGNAFVLDEEMDEAEDLIESGELDDAESLIDDYENKRT